MPSDHLNSAKGDFAETVLLAGDPLRVKFIADNYLDNCRQVNDKRGMYGYTGEYKSKALSIMGHGMGIPSMCIYVTELIQEYGVKNLIRTGSCGGIGSDIDVGDIIVGLGASTDSSVNRIRFNGYDLAAVADYGLIENVVAAARKSGTELKIGSIFSSDLYYSPDKTIVELMQRFNILGVEMEAAGLYGVAAELGARAVTLCSVANHAFTGTHASKEERDRSMRQMIEVALEASLYIVNIDKEPIAK